MAMMGSVWRTEAADINPVVDAWVDLEEVATLQCMSEQITFREVGPRDGIQSLGAFIATPDKIALVNALSETGIQRIEASSFVSPKAVPQMADAADVMRGITRQPGRPL